MKNTFELLPVNGRKSFGGKCKVETAQCVTTGDTISILLSYDTEVATYNHETNVMAVKDYFSAVTMTHTNAFLNHFGFDVCTKKQLEQNYLN